MTSRPLSSRPFVWSVRSTLRHVSTRKNAILQRLKPRTAPSHTVSSPSSSVAAPPSPPPPSPVAADLSRSPRPTTVTVAIDIAPPTTCSSIPLLLASPPRARHHPYQRFSSRSCAPRSPHSDGSGRSSTRLSSSAPTLTSSRSSEWLAAYNEAWEDGTGLDIDPLTEQHVDYYYVADDHVQLSLTKQQLAAPPSAHVSVQQQRCLTDAFPAEWFGDANSSEHITSVESNTPLIDQVAITNIDSSEQRDEQHEQYQQECEQKEAEDADDDDSYTSRLVGLAMLGLYCTQGVDEASCSAAPDVSLPPAATAIGATRTPSLPPRTPSSRARSEFNDVNPQVVSRRSSTSSSSTAASPSLTSTPSYLCSPTLSPMTSSPFLTPGFTASPPSSSPPNGEVLSSKIPSSTPLSPLLSVYTPSSLFQASTDRSLDSISQRQPAQFDASMHQRVSQRLRSRLAVDDSTLSDKRSFTSSPSSSSSPSPSPTPIDERAHHDRFASLTTDSGALCLSAADLPSPHSWLHLGSYLLSTPRVSSLSFQSVCITSAELEMLGHAALSFIRALAFTDNSIGLRPYTLSKLVDILAACEQLQLEQLSITHNSLTTLDPLDSLIQHHPTLTTLQLSHNGISNEGALTLSNAMKRLASSHHFTDFTTLSLNGNRIDGQGVDGLMAARDQLARRTGMEVEVGVEDMRRYVVTPSSRTLDGTTAASVSGGGMSPLALLPLSARLFPPPLTMLGQAAVDGSRVAGSSQTSQRRLTVFRALSLRVMRAQSAGKQTETTELEEE